MMDDHSSISGEEDALIWLSDSDLADITSQLGTYQVVRTTVVSDDDSTPNEGNTHHEAASGGGDSTPTAAVSLDTGDAGDRVSALSLVADSKQAPSETTTSMYNDAASGGEENVKKAEEVLPPTTTVFLDTGDLGSTPSLVADAKQAPSETQTMTKSSKEASREEPAKTITAVSLDTGGLVSTPSMVADSKQATSQQTMATSSNKDTTKSKELCQGISPTIMPPTTLHCPLVTSVETTKRFNFMVAGQSGSGKSSFCYAAFRRQFPNFAMAKPDGPTTRVAECGRGEAVIGNERIIVTVIDTVGHGGQHDRSQLEPIEEYLEEQNSKYERNELFRYTNDHAEDTRIHCLFYFFGPHRVHDVDILFLSRLQDRVAIVPIVSKADSLTIWELAEQLHLIRTRLAEANVHYFDFGESGIPEDWLEKPFDRNTFTRLGMAMEGIDSVPPHNPDLVVRRPMVCNVFAVISNERQYIWGTTSEDDEHHSDTKRLHKVLFGSLGLLAQKTDEIHEQWRMVQPSRHRRLALISLGVALTVALGAVFTIRFINSISSLVLELMCQQIHYSPSEDRCLWN